MKPQSLLLAITLFIFSQSFAQKTVLVKFLSQQYDSNQWVDHESTEYFYDSLVRLDYQDYLLYFRGASSWRKQSTTTFYYGATGLNDSSISVNISGTSNKNVYIYNSKGLLVEHLYDFGGVDNRITYVRNTFDSISTSFSMRYSQNKWDTITQIENNYNSNKLLDTVITYFNNSLYSMNVYTYNGAKKMQRMYTYLHQGSNIFRLEQEFERIYDSSGREVENLTKTRLPGSSTLVNHDKTLYFHDVNNLVSKELYLSYRTSTNSYDSTFQYLYTYKTLTPTTGGSGGGTVQTYVNNEIDSDVETLSIFPNPSNGKVTIKGFEEKIKLRFINNHGEVIYSGRVTNNQQIDLTYLPSGYYVCLIESKNKVSRSRIQLIH